MFEFKIYDTHEVQSFDSDGSLLTKVISYWHKFMLTINYNDLWIVSFREYTLFDSDENPTQCTKVHLSDGSFVYACLKYDSFNKYYRKFLETNFIDKEINQSFPLPE
jgi:hypothetical protein